MIPDTDIEPYIAPSLPSNTMPDRDEITEEGFGYFRGTWYIGRAALQEAEEIVRFEGIVIEALDLAATGASEFELLAKGVENGDWADLPQDLVGVVRDTKLEALADWGGDLHPLRGLEIGVAGLVYALSVIRCPTAASCRSHAGERSWSDCPIVFFAAPSWRAEVLTDLVSIANCGIDADRGMMKIVGSSIRKTHCLARLILDERARFRSKPDPPGSTSDVEAVDAMQTPLFEE